MPNGFKEWSFVCRALGHGAQSLILRKGGIHEGRQGFWWKYDDFFLFPTHFHEQEQQFTWRPADAAGDAVDPEAVAREGQHTITLHARVEEKYQITDWSVVERLNGHHFWTTETLRERFDWSESQGISAALVRVSRLSSPWTFPDERGYGGCRSWLTLPELPAGTSLTPVLDEASHVSRMETLRCVLTGQ